MIIYKTITNQLTQKPAYCILQYTLSSQLQRQNDKYSWRISQILFEIHG